MLEGGPKLVKLESRDSRAGSVQASTRVELFHGFALRHNGHYITASTSVKRLVAYLAVRRRPQHRVSVASTLWLDFPESRAAANLRTVLWRIRRLCDGLVVPVQGDLLALGDGVTCDLDDAIRRGYRLLGESGADGDTTGETDDDDVGDLAEDLLPTWSEDWIIFERERIRQLRVHALESLSRRLVIQGRYGRAVEAALLAIAAEPLRESARRALIEVHLAENNLGEAMRAYEAFADLLRSELGIAPTPDLGIGLPSVKRSTASRSENVPSTLTIERGSSGRDMR